VSERRFTQKFKKKIEKSSKEQAAAQQRRLRGGRLAASPGASNEL